MEKTIDFGHKTNGNKACFNASQKIKHYQIDSKKNKDPFKKAQVNPSISWKGTFFKNGNKKVTDNSIQIIPKNTNTNYPERAIMMTFYEDTQIIDDGKMGRLVALGRQLVLSNTRRDVDLNRIVDLHGVITAFRQKLELSDEIPLIVCVDELIKLREHHIMELRKQSVDESNLKSRATDRCKALRTA